jgi:hypothetical protein
MKNNNEVNPMFYEVLPVEYYMDNKNVESLNDWEFTSAIHYLTSEVKSMDRGQQKFTKSEKLLNSYINKLNNLTLAFKYIYNDMFNRTFNYDNETIANINISFNKEVAPVLKFINNSKKEMNII